MRQVSGSREEIEQELHSLPYWLHTIDIVDGLTTPGVIPKEGAAHVREGFEELNVADKKVLDIGTLDGLWAFESERRGASEVYATDLVSQVAPSREPYFRMAQRILESGARYFPHTSVYDIESLEVRDFDVVLFCGIYYHLQSPLLALAKLRSVMKEGAIILVEGQVFEGDEATAHFFYTRHFAGDRSNWWVPTVACLREWVQSTFFEIEKEYPGPATEDNEFVGRTGRHMLRARAVRRADPNYAFPYPGLERFDVNQYTG